METEKKRKIYIVEDDTYLDKAYDFIFKKENFDVEFSVTGEDAVKYVDSHEPADIVLLDLMLPGMTGFEVLEHIKTLPAWKNVPVLIVSNLGGPQEVEKGKALGASDYLVKASIHLDDVLGSVRHYFNVG